MGNAVYVIPNTVCLHSAIFSLSEWSVQFWETGTIFFLYFEVNAGLRSYWHSLKVKKKTPQKQNFNRLLFYIGVSSLGFL